MSTSAVPAATGGPAPRVDVTFHLPEETEGWPPCRAETLPAELVAPDRARLDGIPMYADGLSRGDVVAIEGAGARFVGGGVLARGRGSTVRVVATDVGQLERVRAALEVTGATSMLGATPPILAVDVPPAASLEHVLLLLDEHSSLTLTYRISCLQHRLTPHEQRDLDPGVSVLHGDQSCALDRAVRGPVARPGDPDWDTARAAWNLAVDQRPALVVEVADAFDVQSVLRYAAAAGLRVAPQSTGHGASPLADLDGTILLRTARMHAVEVDPVSRSVRVEAGAVWG